MSGSVAQQLAPACARPQVGEGCLWFSFSAGAGLGLTAGLSVCTKAGFVEVRGGVSACGTRGLRWTGQRADGATCGSWIYETPPLPKLAAALCLNDFFVC